MLMHKSWSLQLVSSKYMKCTVLRQISSQHCFVSLGVQLNHTEEVAKVEFQTFNLDFMDTPAYFKPGLPFYGKVSAYFINCNFLVIFIFLF